MNIPGFADLQVNGYKGVDFSSPDLTEERFVFACKELIKQGTVAFLPTLISSSLQIYERNLRLISECMNHKDLQPHMLGIHLEGPFISPVDGARGAHNQKWVLKPDVKVLEKLIEWSGRKIKMITIAAEPEGSESICRYASDRGITVSLGHQLASETDLEKLVNAGARSLTHLGNGIPAVLPRHRNPLWAGIANDDLKAMIIADGHHLPLSVLKTIIRTKGVSNLICVSDASPIAGLPPGKYNTLGNDVLLEESGLLHNPRTGYLVGSSATMIDCMNYLKSLKILNMDDLLEVGFYNPLRLINEDPAPLFKSLQARVTIDKNGKFIINDQ